MNVHEAYADIVKHAGLIMSALSKVQCQALSAELNNHFKVMHDQHTGVSANESRTAEPVCDEQRAAMASMIMSGLLANPKRDGDFEQFAQDSVELTNYLLEELNQ